MENLTVLMLSQEEVVAAGGLDMAQTVADVEKVFRLFYQGEYCAPSKVVLHYEDDITSETTKGRINGMPAYVRGDVNIAGIKWIASSPMNPFKHNLPRASALIILNDPDRGVPLAVMDGTVLSAMRTGAATGVGAKYLARPDSKRVGIIGAGTQARTQLMALHHVLPQLEQVAVYDLKLERSQQYAQDMAAELGLEITPVTSAQEATEGSDVVVTVTTSQNPIVKGEWLKPGSFYAQCAGNEADTHTVSQADKVVFDSWEDCHHRGIHTAAIMYDQGTFTDEDIYADIGAIVCGDKPGRTSDTERIVYCPIGLAVEDMIVAKRVYDQAKALGIGQEFKLWDKPIWV